MLYNVEYRILDRLGRTKSTKHIGVFNNEKKVEEVKSSILKNVSFSKVAFDIYAIPDPIFKINLTT